MKTHKNHVHKLLFLSVLSLLVGCSNQEDKGKLASPEEQIRAMRKANGEKFVTDSSVKKEQNKAKQKIDSSWNSEQNQYYISNNDKLSGGKSGEKSK